ncbi:NADPH:quinone oxidoreductase family protein [Marinigracilibium pacificum]|uniref:NADPH:quinone oxidoreductase family protein n=1 Tax=Marinigracilibium pacificum TaxID=2729599 RepID=A0A848IZH7_9BACT|nr:NADPH:quinone oxidoreductase family protein [Marinigracilibium pacificum]NMM49943.1 NADPH:quinone oxidoreductase family protein [Marinigracilibium pacificum]
MKAIRCNSFGPPSTLKFEEISDPESPSENEVLIEIKACGVNFPDTLIIQGLYQVKPELPFIPGSDIAGVVLEKGENVNHLEVGDRIFGFTQTGGFAERIVIPATHCFKLPPNIDFPVAASFMMAYGTSYHALKDRAMVKEGESLVVLGAAGGVGLAAVELGRLMGCNVIAAASSDQKLEICKEYGAHETINYSTEDLKTRIKELTDGKGADVIYDPVGGKYTEAALRASAWEGRLLVVGFASGKIPEILLNLPLLKSCDIRGVFWGNFATKFPKQNFQNSKELLTMLATGRLKPRIHQIYPLKEASLALEEIISRNVKGKVVIEMGKG